MGWPDGARVWAVAAALDLRNASAPLAWRQPSLVSIQSAFALWPSVLHDGRLGLRVAWQTVDGAAVLTNASLC